MAGKNPYEVLGVNKTATTDDIRRAFRAQAKKHHPDLHPGDADAEARFIAANAAHDLLSDPQKRSQFDRGEIDAEGQPAPERGFYRDYAQQAQAGRYRPAGADDEMGDIFGAFFRERMNREARGRDRSYRLDVPFLHTVAGATERLAIPGGGALDVRIPPGLEDGQILRLRGKGEPGDPDGDALIEISILPHPHYRRDGDDIVMELPVSYAEAVLGAKVQAPTPGGRVAITVPPRSDAGTRLRLRGRGIAAHGGRGAGDLFVTLKLVRGPVDDALEKFLQGWAPGQAGFDPRAGLGDAA